MWNALQNAEQRAQLDARSATVATADAVRRAIRQPRVLELVPDARQFEVVSRQCVIPDEIARSVVVPEWPDRDLPGELADRIAARDTGDETFVDVLTSPLLGTRERTWVVLQRGWAAHRADDAETRTAVLDEFATEPEETYRRVVAGVLLLNAEAGRTPPEWAADRAIELDAEIAVGVIDRLRELGFERLGDDIASRTAALETKRRVLEAATARLTLLLTAQRPVVMPAGGELLLWFPEGEDSGRGAVVDPLWLIRAVRDAGHLDPVPWSGELVLSDEVRSGSEPIVAELCSLAVPAPPDAGWSGPLGIGTLLGALTLCFVVGSFVMFRGMRAETAAIRARSEFLQSVTHELKTPLASIRLLAERLETGRVDSERQTEYFGMLADEATRLSVLIENVLDLGRIERGERSYDRRAQDIEDIVHEAVDVFRPLAQRDGMVVEIEGDLAGVSGEVDRGAIVQALLNVLENARKYAKDGARVVVRVSTIDDMLAMDVRDFGPGIPAEERDAVFDRFKRGAAHQHGSVPGVGLGLHLARSIVRAHGGDLSCVQPDGDGVEFRFRVPLVGEVS